MDVREITESVRLFRNDFLEYFSHIHPATPVVVWGPVVLLVSFFGIERMGLMAFLPGFLAGILIWTFTEYMLHRHVFHRSFKSHIGQRVHFLLHGVHHEYPHDGTRLVMPLLVSVPVGVSMYFLARFLCGEAYYGAYAGWVLGYVAYDCIHYSAHHFKMDGPLTRFLKAYHLKHHFQNDASGFGVSNPLWDYVFGTAPR